LATLLASHLGISQCTALYVRATNARAPDNSVSLDVSRNGSKPFEKFLSSEEWHGVEVVPRIEEGPAVAPAILRVADMADADLIVMGARGLSPSSAVLLGNESEQMLIETDRPVLIAKRRGERLGVLEVLLDRDLQPAEPSGFG
jgi:nucleotide-binding universal stress UspA family protein